MAQRRREWLAPMIFESSCCTAVVNSWIEEMLLPTLVKPSVIVMDNATFHNKDTIRQLLEGGGHMLLPLPPYSPDFNPIEESFAVMKKRRIAVQPPQTIEEVLVSNFGLN
jgi:transposase